MKNKVCILMAAYNGGQYIQEQIKTILEQKDVDITLYIRLDPSSDDSQILIQDFVNLYSNIKILPLGEPSGSAGQNFFQLILQVDFSDYDYIAFADQDDIWFPDKLSSAIKCIENNKVDAYSGNVIAWWESGKEKLVHKSSPQKKFDYFFESAGPGCTFVFKKELAVELKHYLKTLGNDVKRLWLHDWFCYAFARSRGYHWFIDSIPMMKYRQHDLNSVGANSGFSALKQRIGEVLSGNAFEKVLVQAELLGLSDEKPMLLLQNNKASTSIRLCLYANQCRRKPVDKAFFMFAMLIRSVVGTK